MSLYFSSQVFVILALISSVLTVLFGAAATYQKDREDEKLRKTHQTELLAKSDQVAELNTQIIALQGEGMRELQHQTSLLTGGSSFPIMSFTQKPNHRPTTFFMDLWVRGRYPLRDFSYRATIPHSNNPRDIRGDAHTLRPSTPISVREVPIEVTQDHETTVRIRYFANNGAWLQTTVFRMNEHSDIEMKTTIHPDHDTSMLLVDTEFGEPLPTILMSDRNATRYSP
ncbi:MAG TPA: hypothetical protein DCS30_13990 [Rhizobiales bacterium]|nr:hypothetical protein [Hyphomicrobiales bacterium]